MNRNAEYEYMETLHAENVVVRRPPVCSDSIPLLICVHEKFGYFLFFCWK